MTESGRLLLIVSCSQRKRLDPGLLPWKERGLEDKVWLEFYLNY